MKMIAESDEVWYFKNGYVIYFIGKDGMTSGFMSAGIDFAAIDDDRTCFIERHAPGCECGVL